MLQPRSCASTPPLPVPAIHNIGWSCIAPASLIRFPQCCLPEATLYRETDHCFNFCHVSQRWPSYSSYQLSAFDVGNQSFPSTGNSTTDETERLRLSLIACLAANGTEVPNDSVVCEANTQESVDPAWTRPSNISCDLVHPSIAAGLLPSSGPTCATRIFLNEKGEGINTDVFDHCSGWAPRRFGGWNKCFEYCRLPRGNAFMGKGDLTADEAIGSFKKCMLKRGGEQALDDVYCTWNETVLDIKAYNVTTKAFLDAAPKSMPSLYGMLFALLLVTLFVGFDGW